MFSPCETAPAAPGRGGTQPGAGRQSSGRSGAEGSGGSPRGLGVQEWPDGDTYEGRYVNGLKHGKGKYTWANGEFFEGSFYKDYRHGDGLYCWPTGHKFTGKFYLNRKEGYGHHLFPDGTSFQGLYHADQRFGPGVISYPDGCNDVGLWLGKRLLKLCSSAEESFSLKNFPEYAACVDSAATTNTLHADCYLPPTTDTQAVADLKLDQHRDLQLDDSSILPPGIEGYSTDGDHLPLPPGQRRELDQHFYGELWEPDTNPHAGYERDPLSVLPLPTRMQTHIHKHRLQAEEVGWDVEAVLSLNREGFGPKGPLEVRSELLIHGASEGEVHTVSQILQTGLVHPDVADSQGNTALITATVNCHNNVIHMLLNMGVDIDMLNCDGMSALAVCHVLYYPFHSLHTTFTGQPTTLNAKGVRSVSTCGNSLQNRRVEMTAATPRLNSRPQTANPSLSSQTNQNHHSDQTPEKQTQSSNASNGGEVINKGFPVLNEPETTSDTRHLQEEEREEEEGEAAEGGSKDTRGGEMSWREDENMKEGETESICSQDNGGGEGEEEGTKVKEEEDVELTEMRESGEEDAEAREEIEQNLEERVKNFLEEDVEREERGNEATLGVQRSIQVLDGHISLSSVQWMDCHLKPAPKVKGKRATKLTFDSARSVCSFSIQVTEEMMQQSAEELSRTEMPLCSDTRETVRRMAAMKVQHRLRMNTLKLLLERGADPNASRAPMPVLFVAVMAADIEAVRRLLLCGAHTDIPLPPEEKGLYPLHVAAALPGPAGPRITELLLHAITDTDAQACDQNEIYEPDKRFTSENPDLKGGGRTALHVACQRDSDYHNASKVVALLLSHRARTDLLWSGHSPLSLAIASGNELAVEELLNGGADPNIPLGHRVGSALCALANIHYHHGGNRAKLLDMLVKAGADILMPVRVGDVVGTVVDYAHYSFDKDLCIANTPFHTLNMREKETFKIRRQLLSMMGDLLRQSVAQREREDLKREEKCISATDSISSHVTVPNYKILPPITEKNRKPFKFCYHCGRSVSVELVTCNRCNKVFYCSKSCKKNGWNERHKKECNQESASAEVTQKRVVFKPQRSPKPVTATFKSKAPPTRLSVRLKPQRAPEPLSKAEKALESEVNLKENYSCN